MNRLQILKTTEIHLTQLREIETWNPVWLYPQMMGTGRRHKAWNVKVNFSLGRGIWNPRWKTRGERQYISLKNALSWFCLGTTFVCYSYWQGHSISLKLSERLQNRFIPISNKPGIPLPFKKMDYASPGRFWGLIWHRPTIFSACLFKQTFYRAV